MVPDQRIQGHRVFNILDMYNHFKIIYRLKLLHTGDICEQTRTLFERLYRYNNHYLD